MALTARLHYDLPNSLPKPTQQQSPTMSEPVFERLRKRLDEAGAKYDVLHHEPVFTSEQAAQVRGTPLASGAKALVCKADGRFAMFVLPADRKLDSKRVRKESGIKSLSFASREDLLALTGLEPGSVPPFGGLFGIETWCDELLAEQPTINFNAGDHSISLSMSFADYERAEQPRRGRFAQ